MTDFAAEFHAVSQLYQQLREELSEALRVNDGADSPSIAGLILEHRSSLAKIEEMSSRVSLLSDLWKKCRPNLDSKSRSQIDAIAKTACDQAIQLQQLFILQTQKLQAAQEKLGKRLAEIGKGTRYLQSVKPVKNNYPKFIDSMY
jgi:hypothetical protein